MANFKGKKHPSNRDWHAVSVFENSASFSACDWKQLLFLLMKRFAAAVGGYCSIHLPRCRVLLVSDTGNNVSAVTSRRQTWRILTARHINISTCQFPEPTMQTFFGAAIGEEIRRWVPEVKLELHPLQSCYETTLCFYWPVRGGRHRPAPFKRGLSLAIHSGGKG